MADPVNKPFVIPAASPGKASAAGFSERRSGPRFPFTAAAQVVELGSQTRITGRCSDLGPGGCYVDTLSPFGVGAAVCVRIEHGSKIFEAAAKVIYSQTSMGMGMAFSEIKPEQLAVLRSWIAELGGEEAAAQAFAAKAAGEERREGATAGEITEVEILQHVLEELIHLLIRRKVVTDKEAAMLLRQFSR